MLEKASYYIESKERIGSGGFGYVEKVLVWNRTKSFHTEYARKVFKPTPDNNTTEIRAVADLRERFSQEVYEQSKLGLTSKYIVPIILHDLNNETPYFIMTLGISSLADDISSNSMSDEDKKNAILSIINGLRAIHGSNFIHRDLKPENIIKFDDGTYKISDFGLMKDEDANRSSVNTRFERNNMGSDGYRAPEVIDLGVFHKESDIYAVGIIIEKLYPQYLDNEQLAQLINKCTARIPASRGSLDSIESDFLSAITAPV